MHPIKALVIAGFFAFSTNIHAKEYCNEFDFKDLEKKLNCWNGLIDKKEAALKNSISTSKIRAKTKGKSYGLDIEETLRLMDKSQKAWKEYSEQECSVQREAIGDGTDRDPQEMNCYLTKLDERIMEVKRNWPK